MCSMRLEFCVRTDVQEDRVDEINSLSSQF